MEQGTGVGISRDAIAHADEQLRNMAQTNAKDAQPQAESAPAEKRTRTTVAKLAQRYQERDRDLAMEILAAEHELEVAHQRLMELKFRQSVWREALAEIEQD